MVDDRLLHVCFRFANRLRIFFCERFSATILFTIYFCVFICGVRLVSVVYTAIAVRSFYRMFCSMLYYIIEPLTYPRIFLLLLSNLAEIRLLVERPDPFLVIKPFFSSIVYPPTGCCKLVILCTVLHYFFPNHYPPPCDIYELASRTVVS